MACCLLHNPINKEMTNDEIAEDYDEGDSTYDTTTGDDIYYIMASNKSGQWRNNLAEEMFSEWELRNH